MDYQVNYRINVDAGPGIQQVEKFATAVKTIVTAKTTLDSSVTNIQSMLNNLDKVFKTSAGKPRKYAYTFEINTKSAEEKLTRIRNLLNEVHGIVSDKSYRLSINAGEILDSKTIKAQANALRNTKKIEENQALARKSAIESVRSVYDAQKTITGTIGKVNSALTHLERGKEINIQTEASKGRLLEILSIMKEIKGLSTMTLNISKGGAPASIAKAMPQSLLNSALYTKSSWQKQQQYINSHKSGIPVLYYNGRKVAPEKESGTSGESSKSSASSGKSNHNAARKVNEVIRGLAHQESVNNTLYGIQRRAAINRMQYSKGFSLRNIPLMHLFNGYMAFGLVKSELTKAMDYANIMESARSILKVADNDLSTFENRFTEMSKNVRQIGLDTKYTAVEIAGATKYLAMAGMDIDTINKSIRPITDLALIGDYDVAQIADLTTNIMAGYNVKADSMNTVADILANTVSRSNVNVMELAHSFKMAAGSLKTSGVDFSEAAAAIGILGNAGIKGTMAGTSLRALSTRFAKPTREARELLDKMDVKFTRIVDVYGKPVEKLRPLADIFEELHRKGATVGDMQTIFSKIAGNAAMMLATHYDKLRALTSENRSSYGIASELALIKQNTTKGLWARVTSQFTEGTLGAFERLEPFIQGVLTDFLERFKAKDFSVGLTKIGEALLNVMSLLGKVATFFISNYNWLEPLIFTTVVSTKLFKLAGALTNVGVALGFIGKQKVSSSVLEVVHGLTGMGGNKFIKGLSYADKRSLVSALKTQGVAGKGNFAKAVTSIGPSNAANILAMGPSAPMISSQVINGNGLLGASASLSSLGAGAVAATAGVSALIAALGLVAYRTWQINKEKKLMIADVNSKMKYRYKSVDDLYDALKKTHEMAQNTNSDLENIKKLSEASGHTIGWWTANWWGALFNPFVTSVGGARYTFQDARFDDTQSAILTLAKRDSQTRIESAWTKLGKMKSVDEVRGFLQTARNIYGQEVGDSINKNLTGDEIPIWTTDPKDNSKVIYRKDIGKMPELVATITPLYADYMNSEAMTSIITAGQAVEKALSGAEGAMETLRIAGLDFSALENLGYKRNSKGIWEQKALDENSKQAERDTYYANEQLAHKMIGDAMLNLRNRFGGQGELVERIVSLAGVSERLYKNEPEYDDKNPYDAGGVTATADDDLAGGNYSGTGKLSTAMPKQVIVNITNLMNIDTIDLLDTPEGQRETVQNLKEQLAHALVDVVHDFDASWNA